jgi:RNA polymerase sigma factor (sigma-70 family)
VTIAEAPTVSELTLAAARTGDGTAFQALTAPYWAELRVHCYRMLGSRQDAEDVLQETMLAAWRALDGFQGRSSLRAWLYRIATNRCLNALRDADRRPRNRYTPEVPLPPATRTGEVTWLEPYPDQLLDGLPDRAPGPEVRYELRESVSLAFLTTLQLLPPRQRAVLVLRDVLGYRAAEVADLLDTDDAWLTMPPLALEYQGRAAIGGFLESVPFREGRRYRLVPVRANGQPAFGCYLLHPRSPVQHPHGLVVLTVADGGICAITRFNDNSLLPAFGLPRTLL